MLEGLPPDTTYAELLEFLKRDLQLDGSTDILPGTLTFDQHNQQGFAPCRVYRNGAYTAGAAGYLQLFAETKSYDPGNHYDNTTTYRYTCPAAGYYLVTGQVRYSVTVVGGLAAINIARTGVFVGEGTITTQGTGDTANQAVSVADIVKCVAGDTLGLYWFASTAAAALGTGTATDNYMSVVRVA